MNFFKGIFETFFGKSKKEESKIELGKTYSENELVSIDSKENNKFPTPVKTKVKRQISDGSKLNKEQAVIDYLKKYGSIDKMTCAEKFNLKRLDNLICELRKQGMNIQNETVELHNEMGQKIKVNNYKLVISDGAN